MIYEQMRVSSSPSRGGALPIYQPKGELHAPGSGVSARIDDSAARIAGAGGDAEARALAGLGNAVKGAVDVGVKAYDDYQNTKATEAYNLFQKAMNEKMYGENGIFIRQGEAAFDSTENMESALRDTAEEVSRQLKLNEYAREKLNRDIYGFSTRFMPKAMEYASEQRMKWADEQDRASLDLNLEGLLNNADDRHMRIMYLSTMEKTYNQYAERNGFSPAKKELGWKRVLSGAYSSLADKFITNGNLNAARELVNEDTLWLEGDQDRIRAKIKAEGERLEAKAKQRQLELRAGLAGRIEDAEAAWRDGLEVQNPPTREEVAAAYGKDAPEVWERLEGLQNLSEDIRGLRAMSPAEQDSLLAERRPEAGEGYAAKSKIFSALTQAVERDRKARADDPAGYLASVEPEVKAARQAMFRNMTPDSVNAYAVALKAAREARGMAGSGAAAFLPESDAKQIAARLEDSPLPMEALQQLSASAGKYWPDMLRQFSGKEGLSGAMRLAASGMDADAGKKLLEAARDKDFAKKAEEVLGVNGATKTDFQNLVRESMADFNKTLLAGGDGDMSARINQNVERLALRYMMDGYETEEAVEKAAGKVILDRYSLAGPTGKQFRVPRKFNADRIGDGAEASLLDAAMPGKLLLPDASLFGEDFTDRTYAAWIRREGYWVTNSDESGAVLFVGGQAVRNTDGSPVERTWDELEGKGMEERNIMGLSREYPW